MINCQKWSQVSSDVCPAQGEEDVIGEIDWDSEWQKVMRGEQDSVSRPKEVTLELERAKRRAVRSTERMIEATRSKVRPELFLALTIPRRLNDCHRGTGCVRMLASTCWPSPR